MLCLVAQSCPTLFNPMDYSPPGFSVHGNSPGKDIGVGCHAFFQEIFPTQEYNPGLLHCKWVLYRLSHQGNPRRLDWIPDPFSGVSSQHRNQTRVSCIAGRFSTRWATGEALKLVYVQLNHFTVLLKLTQNKLQFWKEISKYLYEEY